MKSTAAEIEAALAYYRKISAERCVLKLLLSGPHTTSCVYGLRTKPPISAERIKRLLGVYIDAITKAKFTDELIREETCDEEWKEEQINALRDLVDAELDNLGMFKPTDLLDRFDRFAAALSLEGTSCGRFSLRAAPKLRRRISTLSMPL